MRTTLSKKFNLVQDRDDDSIFGAIKRHAAALAALILVFVLILAIVLAAFTTGRIRAGQEQQQRAQATATRETTQRAEKTAIKKEVADFIASGKFVSYPAMITGSGTYYDGPGPRFASAGEAKTRQRVTVIARMESAPYYLLDNGDWVNTRIIDFFPLDGEKGTLDDNIPNLTVLPY